MARDFTTVYNKIIEAAKGEILEKKLKERSGFWAPELLWSNLSFYVNKYVEPSSKNPKSIKIYSILCDCSEEEMKKRFIVDGK